MTYPTFTTANASGEKTNDIRRYLTTQSVTFLKVMDYAREGRTNGKTIYGLNLHKDPITDKNINKHYRFSDNVIAITAMETPSHITKR